MAELALFIVAVQIQAAFAVIRAALRVDLQNVVMQTIVTQSNLEKFYLVIQASLTDRVLVRSYLEK